MASTLASTGQNGMAIDPIGRAWTGKIFLEFSSKFWEQFQHHSLALKVVQMLLRAGDEAKLEVKDREASSSFLVGKSCRVPAEVFGISRCYRRGIAIETINPV